MGVIKIPYVYRYINLKKMETVYVGKVTRYKDVGYNPLRQRHNQHKGDDWYKDIGEENLLLQYIELPSHADADILETWLINYYPKGQLANKAKTNWGASFLPLENNVFGKWKNFAREWWENDKDIAREVNRIVESFVIQGDELTGDIESGLKCLCDGIRQLKKEYEKAKKFDDHNAQEPFIRKE